MAFLAEVARTLDRLTAILTGWAMVLVLLIAGIQVVITLARSVFDIPLIFAQESILYFFAYFVVLAVIRATQQNAHVRIPNLIPTRFQKNREFFEAAGYLILLLPLAIALLVYALPIAQQSWSILERSRESAGVHLVFVLKSSPVLLAILLALQAIARAAALLSQAWSLKGEED